MSAIRLEKFANPVQIDTHARLVSMAEIEALKQEAFETGIKEGAKAASDAFSAEQSRCLSRIQEVIGDAFFAREEAHRNTMTSLHPLLETMLETLAPSLGQTGLSAEISRIVTEAVTTAPDETISIFVPEGLGKDIAQMLASSAGSVHVIEDPKIKSGQAQIEWSGGFDRIDLQQSADHVAKAIDDFFLELSETNLNEAQNVG